MLSAALIGHLAGGVEEFGWKFPSVIAGYAQAVGFGKQEDFVDALMGAHSHAIVVGAMALALVARWHPDRGQGAAGWRVSARAATP